MEESEELGPNENVVSHGYSIEFVDNFRDSGTSEIQMWTFNRDSHPRFLRITDPSIFCYIELPPMIGSSKITWNEHNIIDITNWLTRVLKNDRPLKYNFEQKNKLYFFRKGQTFPMIRLYFK